MGSGGDYLESQWLIIVGYFKPIMVYLGEEWPIFPATWLSRWSPSAIGDHIGSTLDTKQR